QPAARRRAADIGGCGVELREQLVQILGPFRVFAVAVDGDVGAAGVAPVVDDDAVAGLGDLLAERAHPDRAAPPARLQHDERAALAENVETQLDAADARALHGRPPWSPAVVPGMLERFAGDGKCKSDFSSGRSAPRWCGGWRRRPSATATTLSASPTRRPTRWTRGSPPPSSPRRRRGRASRCASATC